MKRLLNYTLLIISVLIFGASAAMAETPKYKISKWKPTDGGIFTSIAADGKWAVINLGMTGGDTHINCPSRIYDVDNDKDYTVTVSGREMNISAVSNVDENGVITLVGSLLGRPASCKYDTKSNAVILSTLKAYPLKENWQTGNLSAVTPDGKYAVGFQTGYYGIGAHDEQLEFDYWYTTIYVDITSGTVLETPGVPTKNLAGTDECAIKFTGITPDGRYILGEKDWFVMQPNCPLSFIYDTVEHTYKIIGFTGTPGHYKGVVEDLHHIEAPTFSPNGKLITGDAYMARSQEDSQFNNEYHTPFIYNMETGEFINFDDIDSQNVVGTAIDNDGNIYGSPQNGSPLRNFKIFYKQKYWIPFAQICQQIYGFNFSQKTDFEFTGTPSGVSSNGHRFVAFSDPSDAESYVFDFGASFNDIAGDIDLLSNYTATPEARATFSTFKSIEINFGRAVQVIGKGNTHFHLYNKKTGAKVADGLSSSSGIAMKQNSKTIVVFTIRTATLEEGVEYEAVVDAGAVALASDAQMSNREIRIPYMGRKEGPVKITKATPDEGTKLNHLDGGSSYILLTYDCPVQLTDSYEAYIERLEEGGTKTRIATLSLAPGNTEETKNQLLVYPTSTLYLYDGVEYKVTLSAGSVSDYSGAASSYNEEWTRTFIGSYVREVATETTIFIDDFNDPNASLGKWLMYEGDHNAPLSEMAAWGFDRDNTPWNFSTHDTEDTSDYYATSHSLYAPSGKSDDWMMTPQLRMPEDGKAVLTFDAQSYRNKQDHLRIYVIPFDRNVSYLNDQNMAVLKENAELLDDIELIAGKNEALTAEEWTHFSYSLSAYANKDIYIAFVNENENKSAICVDNVVVQKEIIYTIGFNNEERIVNKSEITIAGNFTVKTKDFKSGAITLTLKDAQGKELGNINWPSVSGAFVDRAIPFSFSTPLPLIVGKENKYSIDVTFDGKDANDEAYQRTETYEASILNLAFTPTKRVVLEEMTGTTCPNCPQGHIAIEACERQYKDQFITVGIHSYDGDDLGSQFRGYTSFLKLAGAPSARINRINDIANEGIYYPMYGEGNAVYYDRAESNLWYNVIAQELEKLTICDVNATATYSEDKKQINVYANVKYALDAEQLVSVFMVILEDGITSFQENNFAQSDAQGLGEWGVGGKYGDYYAYPVVHNDVVRTAVGETFAGTLGLLPQKFEAGVEHKAYLGCKTSDAIEDLNKVSAVIMLIDTQTGEIINAVKAKVQENDQAGIESVVMNASADSAIYTTSGVRVNKSPLSSGIYIKNGKKFVVK